MSWRRRSWSASRHDHERAYQRRHPAADDEEGLLLRPGDALVPRLRRLCDPRNRPVAHAGAGRAAGADGVRDGNRLRRALRLLHGHLRDAWHPRARALGAEATFVARAVDTDRNHVAEVLRAAAEHQGTAFVEIYQNCNVFNDGAFDALREKESRKHNMIMLEAGKPIRFGEENERGVVHRPDGSLEIVDVADVGEDALVVHDPEHRDPSRAFALAHLAERPTGPTPVGVFRSVARPAYAEGLHEELEEARESVGDEELAELLGGGDSWTGPST